LVDATRKAICEGWQWESQVSWILRFFEIYLKFKFFSYLIFLQLFIIMGIIWIMEIIPWMFSLEENGFFYFFDFLNCVQGLIIFLICVCNSRVRNLIKSK
jgi:hypothetical protein